MLTPSGVHRPSCWVLEGACLLSGCFARVCFLPEETRVQIAAPGACLLPSYREQRRTRTLEYVALAVLELVAILPPSGIAGVGYHYQMGCFLSILSKRKHGTNPGPTFNLLSFSLGAGGPSTPALAHFPATLTDSLSGVTVGLPFTHQASVQFFPALDGGNPERPGDAESGLHPGCGEPGRVAGGLPPAAGYV